MSIIKFQGEQFTQKIQFSGFGYNDCSQIVVCVFNDSKKVFFVKLIDESNYPDATLIKQTDEDKTIIDLFFNKDVTEDFLGDFRIEVKRVVSGSEQPIIKNFKEAFTFKKSMIK